MHTKFAFSCLIFLLLYGTTALAQPEDPPVGYIDLPYLFGDGGIVAMQAGSVVTVTWVDAPSDAGVYVFVWKSLKDTAWFIMGADRNAQDGISTQWKVRESLTGVPYGVAIYPDGTVVLSRISDIDYASGKAPPEGICSTASMSESPEVFDHLPDEGAYQVVGNLRIYAEVLERVTDANGVPWLKIDLTAPNVLSRLDERLALPEWGWVDARYVRLYGDCSFLD